VCCSELLSIEAFTNPRPPFGDGELFAKKAEGEAFWLAIIVESGEASRDPLVVRPCID